MDAHRRASAPGYDLFKLIVAVILFLIFIFLLLRNTKQLTGLSTQIPTIASLLPTSIPSQTATSIQTSTPTTAPTATASLTPTPIPPTTTETPQPESPTPTPAPLPSNTPSTAESPQSNQSNGCSDLNPSRLKAGMKAVTLVHLNLRSSPGIHDNWILTMPTNTQVEITGDPVCTVYANGSYLWWPVKLADGENGWSAEASQYRATYFLGPIK